MKKALCGDIGGTNANLCIAHYCDQIKITNEVHEPTQKQAEFSQLITHYLSTVEDKPKEACFAVAGPVHNQRVEMTNAGLIIDAKEIQKNTELERVLVINDFDAVGYAINVLDPPDFQVINKGIVERNAPRGAIGAGTGLGKSILLYDQNAQAYLPQSSEGGHVDFPFSSIEEFIYGKGVEQPTYETFLSGRGLELLYQGVQKTRYPDESELLYAMEISQKRKDSLCCHETMELFVKFFARCARNFAIDILATGGIYLAGGIAASNADVFENGFMEEFTRHGNLKYRALLENIPVILIKNYGISLKGAACALTLSGGAGQTVSSTL